MDYQLKKWHDKLIQELAISNVSFSQVHQILSEMKENNINKELANAVLEYTRKSERGQLNEHQEDLILELMDIVTGFCAPENRIWG